ncbi:PA0069 family radical SAM protein [Thauera sinica]|uniref:PA0069 family radical SAM protein n=1 Tax=Thauera sinica TaxID=2665146 RepID=A0ABW1ALJ2_9RHOO|nr:PA0069 family radical SAM protein [Thauera sp. K11]ATE60823.1 radical SAM protein [Thauera sp. K11]
MHVNNYSPSTLTATPRGRGTGLRPDGRFLRWQRAAFDDGWAPEDSGAPARVATRLHIDRAKHVITYNRSPDVPFDRSINPYRGCEHACVYCFARPSHAYLDLSPGLDFETQLFWKPDAAAILRRELAAPGYRCAPIAVGVNTDAWQPVERHTGLTRSILEVLLEARHPVSLITKSALIERDLDLLAGFAHDGLVQVMVSVTTLDDELARRMEPRAARPARRIETIRRLHEAGVPVGVLCAPLIPALNDHELEAVIDAACAAGADSAGYVVLRLPYELRTLFTDWLERNAPERARHVMSLLTDLRGGRQNDPRFGHRMRGTGVLADLYRQRLARLQRRHGLGRMRRDLDTSLFRPPREAGPQLALF